MISPAQDLKTQKHGEPQMDTYLYQIVAANPYAQAGGSFLCGHLVRKRGAVVTTISDDLRVVVNPAGTHTLGMNDETCIIEHDIIDGEPSLFGPRLDELARTTEFEHIQRILARGEFITTTDEAAIETVLSMMVDIYTALIDPDETTRD